MRTLIVTIVFAVAITAGAQWTVVNLHPDGASESGATAVHGGQQVGYAIVGELNRASLWSGSAASWMDLTPASATESFATGSEGNQQVGWARVSGPQHASLWSGSAASWVDLHPSWATSSVAYGIGDGRQVGMVESNNRERACLWSGTPESWFDLHPVGARESIARAVSGNYQAGSTFTDGLDTVASSWSDTPESWVNLHPAVARWSEVFGVDGDEQAGYAFINGKTHATQHASLWKGTAESWVNLNPFAAGSSFARGNHAGQQVGHCTELVVAPSRACLWTGTPGSLVNLHEFLPSSFSSSRANGIFHDGDFTYVVGAGTNSSNLQEALMWVSREVVPDSYSLLRGSVFSGDLASVLERDNNRLVLRPGPVFSTSQPPVQIAFNSTAPSGSPEGFSFSIESSASFGNALQAVSLWNFTTGAYELLDSRLVKLTDDVVCLTIRNGNPSRFIEPGTLAIRTLVTYRAVGPSFVFPWSSRIDAVWWNFPG